MPRQSQPDMEDVTDADIHSREGVDPYPLPKKTRQGAQPQPDEATSTQANNHERGEVDADGNYVDAADAMRVSVADEGERAAWKKGQTQGKPKPN